MATQNKKLYSLDEIINLSLPLPLFFTNDSGRQLVVYPFNYFWNDKLINEYAFRKGVLIFKFNGQSYATIYSKRLEEVFKTLHFRKINFFPGFDPHDLHPRDEKLSQRWTELLKKLETDN